MSPDARGVSSTSPAARAAASFLDDEALFKDDPTDSAEVGSAAVTSPAAWSDPESPHASMEPEAPVAPVTVDLPPSSGPRRASNQASHRPTTERVGRREVRVVRRVQLWSVFKVALLASAGCYVICLIAVAILWSLASTTGQVHHIEKFMREIGFNNWTFKGGQLFQGVVLIGAVGLVVTSAMVTVWAALVNVVSELTGGIRFVVIEAGPEPEDE